MFHVEQPRMYPLEIRSDSNYKLVLVEWVDSTQPIPSWRFLDDAPELEVIKCCSVGWLVAENDGVKMIAPNIGGVAEGAPQGSGFIRIPTTCITRIVGLAEC